MCGGCCDVWWAQRVRVTLLRACDVFSFVWGGPQVTHDPVSGALIGLPEEWRKVTCDV